MTAKAWCARHHYAYDRDRGCVDCRARTLESLAEAADQMVNDVRLQQTEPAPAAAEPDDYLDGYYAYPVFV